MEYRFLSLNDTQELHRMHVGQCEFVFTGAARGKARFATTAMRAARRRPELVLAAHPNLAPIVRGMQVIAPRMKSIVCTHGIEVWEPLPSWSTMATAGVAGAVAEPRDRGFTYQCARRAAHASPRTSLGTGSGF